MLKKMKKMYVGAILLVIIVGIVACNFLNRNKDGSSPTTPASNAEVLINMFVTGHTCDNYYEGYLTGGRFFGVYLEDGCWIIEYTTTTGIYYAEAYVHKGPAGGMAHVGVKDTDGVVLSVRVFKTADTCADTKPNEVRFLATYVPPKDPDWHDVVFSCQKPSFESHNFMQSATQAVTVSVDE